MAENQEILMQFSYEKKILLYKNKSVFPSQEECDEFLGSFPETISTENDLLKSFTYFDDDFCLFEKRKRYYDFRQKDYAEKYYIPEFTIEEIQLIKSKFDDWYNTLRLAHLQEQKDSIKDRITQSFGVISTSLRSLRNSLLQKSDWTQIPDNSLSEEVRLLWRTFRQYLRDITNDVDWNSLSALEVKFPIDPTNYLMRYPNQEVEYLSTEDQFENQIANRTKAKLLGFIDYLNFIEDTTQSDEINIKSPTSNYVNLTDYINKKLAKIDPDLKITITSDRISEYTLPESLSGVTPEMVELISSMISDPVKASQFTIDELNSMSEYVEAYKQLYDNISQ